MREKYEKLLFNAGSGSQGLDSVMTSDVKDLYTSKALKYKPGNKDLKNTIIRIQFNESIGDFKCESVQVRPSPKGRRAF